MMCRRKYTTFRAGGVLYAWVLGPEKTHGKYLEYRDFGANQGWRMFSTSSQYRIPVSRFTELVTERRYVMVPSTEQPRIPKSVLK